MAELKKRKLEEVDNSDVSEETLRSLLEPLAKPQLIDLLAKLGSKYSYIAEEIMNTASGDRVHRRLFVRGLAWNTSSEKLCAAFEVHGEIEEGAVIHDKITGNCRGFGFITYKNIKSAQEALRESSKLIDGRLAVCNLACEGISSATITPDQAQRKLYIGGLSPETTTEILLSFFSRHGELLEGSVAYDKDTNSCRGFGFVTYKTLEATIKALNDTERILGGCNITVKYADKKSRTTPNQQPQAPVLVTSPMVAPPPLVSTRNMKSAQEALESSSKYIDGRLTECNLACEGSSSANITPDQAQRKLYIGGLSPETTTEILLSFFRRHGEIVEGSVLYDKDTNRSRCFGFVTYKTLEATKKALDDTDRILGGCNITVKYADTKSKTTPNQQPQAPVLVTSPMVAPPPLVSTRNMKSAQEALGASSKYIDGRLTECNLACEGLSSANITPNPAQRKLYIWGLSPETTTEMLLSFFSRHGEIVEGSVVYDKDTNRSRGFGFVTYKTLEATKKALDDTDRILGGRNILVKYADTKSRTPPNQQPLAPVLVTSPMVAPPPLVNLYPQPQAPVLVTSPMVTPPPLVNPYPQPQAPVLVTSPMVTPPPLVNPYPQPKAPVLVTSPMVTPPPLVNPYPQPGPAECQSVRLSSYYTYSQSVSSYPSATSYASPPIASTPAPYAPPPQFTYLPCLPTLPSNTELKYL